MIDPATIRIDSWDAFGYNPFGVNTIQPADPNYVSDWDFETNYADKVISNSKINADIMIKGNKRIIVQDETGVNRVLIGYQKDGFA